MRTPARTRRTPSALTASACALLLALTVSACGDDGEMLPVAKDREAVALFLDKHVGCQDTDYYVGDELLEFRAQVSYAVDSAGDCDVNDDTDIDFLHFSSLGDFQKDVANSEIADDTGLMVGMTFAVDADDEENAKALLDAGLLYLVCEPGVDIPNTYRQDEGEAGCVLTDYAREEQEEDY
ncbi:hypothetical protein ACSCB1_39760 [Streptomyces europaeiscabiei]|uniref:Lipoprotein n=1 Tax=Streptomyces europaeiscabiei TaxID=146819 RepID=A0ABU4NM18_9ACTN|nr:hypothetical protein [Streptomyces europaeiscabiei]MDX2528514.1 hypothetical protein [Streptomyces europaeiscabiei]MDX2762269.1 hypothetical protein [Streptomyces europaeiscabiei]MDX2771790.1 hypothetical protein [Streptomyces europaeiscabiei]MDX3546257.1 hypothetical protein [Streptomyces europaeiscabiei]MDX3557437.1 hypothetical protein [Streptomyces europaeiscabiei]